MNASLNRLSYGLLAAIAIVAAATGYWAVVRSGDLLARDDNPRRVLAEQRIQRGQILDRSGTVLALTQLDSNGTGTRVYPHPETAPVVGYHSIQYGVGGVEAEYDQLLRGQADSLTWDELARSLLHTPQAGGDVRLTLSLPVQEQVARALAGHTGAVVVISLPDGEILAMASQPTFDPNQLDTEWESLIDDPAAPLLNRATQGLYQPGTILQSVLLGAGLNTGQIALSDPWIGLPTLSLNGTTFPCASDLAGETLADAYLAACPMPFRAVAQQLGAERLDAALADFALLQPPELDLPTEAAALEQAPAQSNLHLTAVGQSDLRVTPLHMAQLAAAFADHGQVPALRLVAATREHGGRWQDMQPRGHPRGTISPDSADAVAALMAQAVLSGAARAAAIPGQTVHGHAGLALSGPGGTLNAWFIGFVHYEQEQGIAVSVLIEDAPSAAIAAEIGGQALQAAVGSALPR
jgi:peptidoglycan glycosyltransferase